MGLADMDDLYIKWLELFEAGEINDDFEGWYADVCARAHDRADLER